MPGEGTGEGNYIRGKQWGGQRPSGEGREGKLLHGRALVLHGCDNITDVSSRNLAYQASPIRRYDFNLNVSRYCTVRHFTKSCKQSISGSEDLKIRSD